MAPSRASRCPAMEPVFLAAGAPHASKTHPAPPRLPKNGQSLNARRASSSCTLPPPNQIPRSINMSVCPLCSVAVRRGPQSVAHTLELALALLQCDTSNLDSSDLLSVFAL